jgi:hypothetical protein
VECAGSTRLQARGAACDYQPQHGGWRGLTLIVLIGTVFVAVAALRLAEAIRTRGQRSAGTLICGIAGVVLIAYGVLGFLGAFLSATGRLPWRSEDTAFPMGRVDGAVIDADGLIYCPSPPWGRIQLYDRDKRFIRGWFVNAFGGVFRIHVNAQNHLEVATARRRMLYVFDREGHLLSSASYEPRAYADFDNWRGSVISIDAALSAAPDASGLRVLIAAPGMSC